MPSMRAMIARSFLERFLLFRNSDSVRSFAVVLIGLGIIVRILAWGILPPIWKLHATFNALEMPVIEYVSNFEGYKPSRMPFFDVLSALFYIPLSNLLSYRALTLFTLVLSCVSVPVFYFAVKRLFSSRVAIPALAMFALYPKFLFLTGRGMPEAVAAGFVVFSLYFLVLAFDSGRVRWYALAGVAALLSYLMFVAAVLFGIVVSGFLYSRQVRTGEGLDRLKPKNTSLAFSIPSGIVGVLYLIYGPIQTMVSTGGINKVSLFVDPSSYGFVEKTFRYGAYTYFDFWWHTRGFDQESGILPTLSSLWDFLGPLAPVYFAGWICITLVLSLATLYGLVVLIREREPVGQLVIAIMAVFIFAFHYRNTGYAGAFQTRHVFPVFPAVCICFGIGVSRARTQMSASLPEWAPMVEYIKMPRFAHVAVLLLLLVLVFNGGVQGMIRAEKVSEGQQAQIEAVDGIVDDDETVGVLRTRAYHNMLIYTDGETRPTLLHDLDHPQDGKFTTRLATYNEVNPNDLNTFGVDYVYVRIEYNYLDRDLYNVEMNQEFVDRLEQEGNVVYHDEVGADSFRTTNTEVFLVQLEGQ